ncbi:MAG: spore coat U domain-containing protein [Burkholderiaceae bacterium]|jgi:spore coat protein U-like protein
MQRRAAVKRLLAAACLALAARGAHAQVACNVSVAPLGFGVYDTLSPADNQVAGDVTLECQLIASNAARRISYSIAIGAGDSGSFARRTMRAPARPDRLGYNVYLTRVSPSTIWGDGTGGSVPATGSITVNKNSSRKPPRIPMIGVIPAGQTVGAGVYSDTLMVTVTWN